MSVVKTAVYPFQHCPLYCSVRQGIVALGMAGALAGAIQAQVLPKVIDLSGLNTNTPTGTPGLIINGIDAGDSSGSSVSNAGDINGDDVDDLLIGASLADPNSNNLAGETYVIFGSTDLDTLVSPVINLSSLNTDTPDARGLIINGIDANDFSGFSVSNGGDVNGDGIDDLLIGAFFADPNGNTDAGEIYIIFGDAGLGTLVSSEINLSSLNTSTPDVLGLIINGIDLGDRSGFSVSSAGDINGDDIDDLLIGSRNADPNGNNSGETYVIFGSTVLNTLAPPVINLSSLANETPDVAGLIINGIDAHDRAGGSVSSAGDINGDGIDDLLIGARDADPNELSYAGETYVLFGGTGLDMLPTPFINLSSLATGTPDISGLVINGIDANDLSGDAVSSAGDINGDGIDDLLIGASTANPNDNDRAGETYVIFGGVSLDTLAPPVINLSSLNTDVPDTPGLTINGIDASDYSARFVSNAGDINGDGIDDLLIGATDADPNGNFNAGETYVIFGSTGMDALASPVIDLSSLNTAAPDTPGLIINGIDEGDFSGTSVSNAGDVNSDGVDDLLIGSRAADPNGNIGASETYVIFGVVALFDQTRSQILPGIVSQDFETASDVLDAFLVDDFVVDTDPASSPGWLVDTITIIGSFKNGGGPIAMVNITFYPDANGSPDVANPVCTFPALIADDGGINASFTVKLPDDCFLPSDGSTVYWLEQQVQANIGIAVHQWAGSLPINGVPSQYKNPGEGVTNGCVTYMLAGSVCGVGDGIDTDRAFALSGRIAPPVFDLTVNKTNGAAFINPDDTVSYSILVENLGPNDVIGATVIDILPSNLINVQWGCAASGGASCTATGSGNINDMVDLPVGSLVEYSLNADTTTGEGGIVSNTVSVQGPIGLTDLDSSNNTSTDSDVVTRVFADNFEDE